MKQFVTYRSAMGYRAACRVGDVLVDLQRASMLVRGLADDALPADLPGLLAIFGGLGPLVEAVDRALAAGRSPHGLSPFLSAQTLQFGPPVTAPGKIVCVGLNYPAETGGGRPDYPTLFLKAASTLIADREAVRLPGAARRVFCEGELVLVIGRSCRRIVPEQAWEYVAGVTIANDVGAEDLEARTSQWQTGKLPDTFLPLGPHIVPVDPSDPPEHLAIRVRINDRQVLGGSTDEMLFSPAELVAYISSFATLHPGDLVVTGSPKKNGSAPAAKAYIAPGDEIEVEVDGIGVLRNRVETEESEDG